MLLDLSVIVQSCTALTLEWRDIRILCRTIHRHVSATSSTLVEAIAPLVVHLLLIVLKLLIILVLVLIAIELILLWDLTRLIISRLLLHIHTLVILLIYPINFLLLCLLLFLAGENIRHRICYTNSSNYNQRI